MKNFLLIDGQQFAYDTYSHTVDSHFNLVQDSSLYNTSLSAAPQKAQALKATPYRFEYICARNNEELYLQDDSDKKIELHIDKMCEHIIQHRPFNNWTAVVKKLDGTLQWMYRSNDDRKLHDLFSHQLIDNGEDLIVKNIIHIYQPIKDVRLFYALVNYQQIMISNIEFNSEHINIDYCDYHNGTMKEMIYFPRWKRCFENSNIIVAQSKKFSVDLFERCGYNMKGKDFDFSQIPVKIKTDLLYNQIGVGQYEFEINNTHGFIYISIPTQLGGSQDDGVNMQHTYLVYKRDSYENN